MQYKSQNAVRLRSLTLEKRGIFGNQPSDLWARFVVHRVTGPQLQAEKLEKGPRVEIECLVLLVLNSYFGALIRSTTAVPSL